MPLPRSLALAGRVAPVLILAMAMLCGAGPARAAAPPVPVYPLAGTHYNLPQSQIAFHGVSIRTIGKLRVVGSRTGVHAGRLWADSAGQGASFVPDKPFAPGETVTVFTRLNVVGASNGRFSFMIAHPAGAIPPAPLPLISAGRSGVQHFASRPDLQPASVTVEKNAAPASEGDIFVAPQFGPAQDGPMILDPQGNLIWFRPYPVAGGTLIADFRVQDLYGQPVLTWWQGATNAGYGLGEGIIFNRDYREIATVRAADGLQADLHEFMVTPQGDAYLMAGSPVWLPGASHPVIDAVVQEIDIRTGLLLFEWHALDHVPTSASYLPVPYVKSHPWDPFHANSISLSSDGNLVVSMRDTSAVYKVQRSTGRVLWTLGGRYSSFKMGAGTFTFFQHDAVVQPDGTLTIFDDGGGPPKVHTYSRGIHESLDTTHMTVALLAEYDHSPAISADFEGGVQALPGGESFIGWGQQPNFSEYNAAGQQDFDACFTVPTSSYRAYRFAWNAQPPTLPALAVSPGSDGTTNLSASWNGATDVSSWQVIAGASPSSLMPIGGSAKRGFETPIAVHSDEMYFAVRALGSSGQVLATSRAVARPVHLAIYGRNAFVTPSTGLGSLPASCAATYPCHIITTVYSGHSLLARTGSESIPTGSSGLLYFRLSPQGRRRLGQAPGGRLSVQVSTQDVSGMRATQGMSLVAFYTSGPGPHRAAINAASLRIVGLTDFVFSNGTGGILAGCVSVAPCHVRTTLRVGRTVIARTGSEFLGANELGYLVFTLTPGGRALLVHARGNQLGARLSISDGSAVATADLALVGVR
ncbi:MAG: arylsulfotransferase family protein [Solirubrobacteraceae bacterium]